MSIFSRILKAGEGRKIKVLERVVAPINALEPEMERLSDEELSHRTKQFRERLDNGETPDDLLIDAFATV